MASRDLQGSGRSIRLLSRDDRDRDDRDGRRDRDRRRREDRERRRDRETDNSKPVQGPIVLLKRPDAKSSSTSTSVSGDRVGEQSSSNTAINVDSSLKPPAGPTLILQRSSKQDVTGDQSGADKGKTSGPPALTDILRASYQFPGGRAMKLIDSNMKMCPWKNFDYDVNNYVGNTDYLVITAIGRPNVGKSTILSYLSGNDNLGKRNIFPPRSREEELHSSIYISPDQMVFIELSSVYNQAATNDLIPHVAQQGVLEVSNVTWNLRLVRWALSVSHIILIISENVFEPSVFQLMSSAEIIHPMDSALGEGSYPELLYVCNKANLELMDNIEVAQEFQKHFTSVTGRTPRIASNYFVLPHTKYEMEQERFEDFKHSISEFSRYNRAPFAPEKEGLTKLVQRHTIQEWFQNSSRLWDEMNSPSYFSSYVKLLP